MVYKAALIGCHGTGKTTLARKLEKYGFTIFDEGAINKFMGVNSLLSELQIIMNRLLINKDIKDFKGKAISDRCTFIDALLYTHGFNKLGWLSDKELKIVYSVINELDYEWIFPEVLLCMTNTKEAIKQNILKRNRDERFNEFNKEYLNVMYELYNDFFLGKFKFSQLRYGLRQKINSIPKVFFKCTHEVSDILNLVDLTNKSEEMPFFCLK